VSYTSGHLIYRNRIGVNKNGVQYPNGTGISISGNVENVSIGTDEVDNYLPNIIVGNGETGLEVKTLSGYSPNEIVFRKNLIYQNSLLNLYVDSLSNVGFKSPFGLSMNGNTLSGFHSLPSMIIDVYKANRFELALSAYEWLGSTTTNTNGAFSLVVSDPSVEAVAVTATNPLSGVTSGFAKQSLLTGVENKVNLQPEAFSLEQNYPNPFNPSTTISFSLPLKSFVSLKVYDLIGREVATLISEEMSASIHTKQWNPATMPSGTYFYRLQSGTNTETKKLVLMK
jgi:hypothetical protein